MKAFIILTVLIGLTFSCKKDRLKKLDGINYPSESQSFDVNENGVADFQLRFSQVSNKDIPVSESVILGKFIEMNATIVLPHSAGKTFNLAKGDTIKRPGEFMDLVYYERIVISRNWKDEIWEESWTVNAEKTNTYYLGYLLADGSNKDLGWAQFDISEKDASVTLITSKHTAEDFIVID